MDLEKGGGFKKTTRKHRFSFKNLIEAKVTEIYHSPLLGTALVGKVCLQCCAPFQSLSQQKPV